MSNRYRVEVGALGRVLIFSILDYCVDVGSLPKLVEPFANADTAYSKAQEMNKEDGIAKAAWDAHNRPAPWKGVCMAAPGTEDATVAISARSGVFSMDVETHAKRYFIGPGGLAVYGTHEAIDAMRDKLNARYVRIQELSKTIAQLHMNLKDAQAAADKFKAAANEIDGFTAAEWRNRYFGEVNKRREILAEYELCLEAAKSRSIGVMLVEHIKNLEKKVNGFELSELSNYWKIQRRYQSCV